MTLTKYQLENYLSLFTDETVIKFQKKFESGDIWYMYVALKLAGRWHTTGGDKFTSEQFAAWLLNGGWKKHKILAGRQE